MSKQQKQQAKSKNSLNNKTEKNSFVTIEAWFEKNDKKLFYLFSFLCLLFSLLHFNARISEGGDDSAYIFAGYKYIQDFPNYYFSFNAPLYPMFLSLPIAMFGLKLIVLKSFSVVFTFLHFFFMYKAFRGRIPNLVFYPVMFFICVNAFLQYFASQTYNEAFFLCFQGLYFYLFVKLYDALQEHGSDLKKTYKLWLAIGFVALILSLAKNVAIVAVPAAILFFIVNKQYKNALYYTGSFGIFKVLFEIVKRIIWGGVGQYSEQGSILLLKDPYKKSLGNDDFSGFVGRFFDNSTIYLSKRTFQIFGFMKEESLVTNGLLAFIVWGLILFGALWAFKKKRNDILFHASIYILASVFVSFIALQVRWDQTRIILIFVPILLFIVFYGLYYSFYNSSIGRGIIIIFIGLIISSSLISSLKRAGENIPILSKNLKGDVYYGYTPDWVNYLKTSEWAAKNLPDTSLVACRKGSMSFIYGHGKEFYAIYRVFAIDTLTNKVNPDSVLAVLKRDKVTHVIIASLRRDPRKADGTFINTLHNLMGPVAQKYPQKLRLIHKEGQIETSELYEIKY